MAAKYVPRAKRKKKHPGFKGVASSIAQRDGVSMNSADKILGAATNKNPFLKARAAAARKGPGY